MEPSARNVGSERPPAPHGPLITVVIPIFKVETYVADTVRSVVAGIRPEVEVILVDDGSPDQSLAVAVSELDRAGVEHVVIRQRNRGVSAARNAGLASASGDYVLFLDGDDMVDPALFRILMPLMAADGPDILCWHFREVPTRAREDWKSPATPKPPTSHLDGPGVLRRLAVDGTPPLWTGSLAYRRAFLTRASLVHTEGCVCGEDREFIYKALGAARTCIVLHATLSFWVQRDDSLTRTYDVRRFDAVPAFQRAFDHLEHSESEQVRELAAQVRDQTIREHYFYNLSANAVAATSAQRRQLLSEIDVVYPGVNEQIDAMLRRTRSLPLPFRLFRLSPSLYFAYVLLRSRAQRIARTTRRRGVGREQVARGFAASPTRSRLG